MRENNFERISMKANEKQYHPSRSEKWLLVLVALLFVLTTIK